MLRLKATIFAAAAGFALAGCAGNFSTPSYSENRAIDQDIASTHVVGPTTTSPAFTQENTALPTTLAPWHNEQLVELPPGAD
jgi:hypothetical protein